MPFTLYFLRHGLAGDRTTWTGAPDSERPLTAEGIKRMQAEARAIDSLNLQIDVIISSPLVRARQTAEIVAQRLQRRVRIDPSLAPGFTIGQLGHILAEQTQASEDEPARSRKRTANGDADRVVLLIGHDPDFSQIVGGLISNSTVVGTEPRARIMLKKGGLARVDVSSIDPPTRGVGLATPATPVEKRLIVPIDTNLQ